MKVAIIGLGAMGAGMARNLAKEGFEVSGYDIDSKIAASVKDEQIRICATQADAAKDAAIVFVVVFRDSQAEAILFESGNVLDTAKPGAVIVMNTTVSPDDARAMATRLSERSFEYIDAPVTGGKAGADEATMTIIAAGSEEVLSRVSRAFDAISGRTYHVGTEIGAASTVKMANQMLVGMHVVAMCEALAFATRAGANPKTVYDVITHGAGNSLAFEGRAPKIFARDYTPRGVVEILTKDLGIVGQAAHALDFPLPLTSAALQQFLAAAASGYGRDDDISVIKIYEKIANVDVAGACEETED